MEWTGYCFKLQTSPKGDEGCKWGISEVNLQDASNLICFWMITELADCVPEYLIMLLSEWCPEGCYHIWTSSFSCPRQIEHSVFKKHQQLIRPLCYSQSGRSACMCFFPQHRNNPGHYPNTNRQICWLMQWVAASGWRRRWLSACFDLFQGRTEIHLISFHWLIIREKITVMALIKVRQQVNSSWSTNSRKKLWCTQARCHSALLLFQYSKQ